jgi:glutathione S-transferase
MNVKLHDFKMAPNARRVRIFAAEKQIPLELINVDLAESAQLGEAFRAVNPRLAVPVLELDDGTLITESVAICRYLEEIQPEPALFGSGPLGKALVEMWHRRVELEGLMAVAEGVRNSSAFFAGRAIAGPVDFEQIPALAERGRRRTELFQAMLDERLAGSEFVAGDAYSVADITALVACDFAKVLKIRVEERHPHLKRWYEAVSGRPSASA